MRNTTRLLAVALTFGLATADRCRAYEVDVPPGTVVLAKIERDADGEIPAAWMVYDGYQPLRAPAGPAPSGAPPFRFMQPGLVAAKNQPVGGGEFLLLVETDKEGNVRNRLGWVDARYVLRRPNAQTRGSGLYRKGLIVNTINSLEAEGGKVSPVNLTLKPSLDAPSQDTLRLFNIYFIYADTEPSRPDEGHVLIGTQQDFTPGQVSAGIEAARRYILGWVPKRRVCLWDTREAMEWSSVPRASPGVIHGHFKDAMAQLAGGDRKSFFEEVFDKDNKPIVMPHDRMRYPIVPFDEQDRKELAELAKLKIKDGALPEERSRPLPVVVDGNNLFKVGMVGAFVNASGQVVADQGEIERLQRQLTEVSRQLQVTDLLFVIDDTGSMERWFGTVATAVKEIIDTARKGNKPGHVLRVAISYFNDVTDEANLKKAVVPRPLGQDGVTGTGLNMVEELGKHRPASGGDPRERVFYGITQSVKEAGFKTDSRKIVILLGDDGDKSDPEDEAPARAVVDALFPENQTPVEFYAVQVDNPDRDSDTKAFRKQAETVARLWRERAFADLKKHHDQTKFKDGPLTADSLRDRADVFSTENEGQVSARILRRVRQLQGVESELQAAIDQFKQGRFEIESTRIGAELELLLHRRGISIDKLRSAKGFQLFHYGYVWEKDPRGKQQLLKRLLLNGGDMNGFVDLLGRFEKKTAGGLAQKKVTLKDVFMELVKEQGGETDPNLSFEAAQSKSMGLQFKSPLLKRPINEIEENKVTAKERQQIILRKMKLEDAFNNMSYRYEERVTEISGLVTREWDRIQPGTSTKRTFYIGSSDNRTQWWWIDFEEEWP